MAKDDDTPRDDDTAGSGDDFQSERKDLGSSRPKVGTALVETSTGRQLALQYVDVGGVAMVEGDIALGPVDEVDQRSQVRGPGVASAVAITGVQYRWTNCTVPYEIDPNLPNQARVTDAIAHWEANTGLKFVVRTNQNNWVYFTDDGGCWSYVGMRGGRQTISVSSGCSLGNTIHEIGHAVGLWHEQSREDRDTFVTINWANIQSGTESNFAQHINDGEDVGGYDYGSIMHYPRKAFSKNNQDTIVPVDPNAQIGQRNGLSAGDIAAIRQLYPSCHRVVKQPWREPTHFKKVVDDRRFKKVFDDERLLKPLRDRIVINPIEPIKRDVRPEILNPGLINPGVLNPGRMGDLQPFSLATPHHADLGGDAAAAEAAATTAGLLETLQQQLLEAEAAVARARASAADAALEVTRLESVRSQIEQAYSEAMTAMGDSDQWS